jgi:hypothetical protein
MPTPQFNVRVPEQYHDLLRLIVERLRANPNGADALADALTAVCRQSAGSGAISADRLSAAADSLPSSAVSDRLDAIERRHEDLHILLDTIQERLARQEQTTVELTTFTQSIKEGIVKDRARAGSPPASKRASKVPTAPRPAEPSDRSIPVEHVEEAARLWDGGKGPSIAKIIAAKGWTHHRSALGKKVKRYLEQSSDQAEPAGHVDENLETPTA